jgi:hypothetical protein
MWQSMCVWPHTGYKPLPNAGARHERTLEAVSSRRV